MSVRWEIAGHTGVASARGAVLGIVDVYGTVDALLADLQGAEKGIDTGSARDGGCCESDLKQVLHDVPGLQCAGNCSDKERNGACWWKRVMPSHDRSLTNSR
jgi:hypothetical protein